LKRKNQKKPKRKNLKKSGKHSFKNFSSFFPNFQVVFALELVILW